MTVVAEVRQAGDNTLEARLNQAAICSKPEVDSGLTWPQRGFGWRWSQPDESKRGDNSNQRTTKQTIPHISPGLLDWYEGAETSKTGKKGTKLTVVLNDRSRRRRGWLILSAWTLALGALMGFYKLSNDQVRHDQQVLRSALPQIEFGDPSLLAFNGTGIGLIRNLGIGADAINVSQWDGGGARLEFTIRHAIASSRVQVTLDAKGQVVDLQFT